MTSDEIRQFMYNAMEQLKAAGTPGAAAVQLQTTNLFLQAEQAAQLSDISIALNSIAGYLEGEARQKAAIEAARDHSTNAVKLCASRRYHIIDRIIEFANINLAVCACTFTHTFAQDIHLNIGDAMKLNGSPFPITQDIEATNADE